MHNPSFRAHAFSLVEVTLALGVMAFCLVAVMGLLPVGFNSNQAAIEQTAAAGIAAGLVADLRQTPVGTVSTPAQISPRYQITIPAITGSSTAIATLFLTEDGTVASSTPSTAENAAIDVTQNPRYRATMVFARSGSVTGDRSATSVRMMVTWPALSDPAGGTLPKQFSGSFETMIALDRN